MHREALPPAACHAGNPRLGLGDTANVAAGRNACRFITCSGHTYLLLTNADPEPLITHVRISAAKTLFTVPAGNQEWGIACAIHFSSHRRAESANTLPTAQATSFTKQLTGGYKRANPPVEEAFVRERKAAGKTGAAHCLISAQEQQ